jgi:hypothetical protein
LNNISNISTISKLSKRYQICKGISLSPKIWSQIDKDKGDISRSRFIQRLIEKAYSTGSLVMDIKYQKISSHDSSPGRQISCEPSSHKKPLEADIHEDK